MICEIKSEFNIIFLLTLLIKYFLVLLHRASLKGAKSKEGNRIRTERRLRCSFFCCCREFASMLGF